jgi:glycine betaine/choline ABC-type transport system substrate-binding protein
MNLSRRHSTVAIVTTGVAIAFAVSACGSSSSGNTPASGGSSAPVASSAPASTAPATSTSPAATGHPLVIAGPPECPTRPFCELGLKQTYGMVFKGFKQTDDGGALTVKALTSGAADVGLVFTSDPTIESHGLVVLTDDKNLQASDNIVPLVASKLSSGAAASALNAVDAKLDQTTLVSINKAVEIDRGTPTAVATQFLSQEKLNTAAALCGGSTGSGKVAIGAADFPENETLAAIYADALKTCGYSTSTKTFASREVYYPEMVKGKLQVIPEYAATLTDFINDAKNGANAPSKASGDINKTMAALKAELPSSLAVLNPATSTDKNAFAVTKKFATANNITTLSQLAAYSKG